MPFVNRTGGLVSGVFVMPQVPGQEELPEGHADILAFRAKSYRRPRTLYAIYTDIGALSAGNQATIWTDIISGSPPKWSLDAGQNAAAIMALHWSAANSGASAANLNDAKRRLVAAYCQDNPGYLVNPVFLPAVNIPGDQADV